MYVSHCTKTLVIPALRINFAKRSDSATYHQRPASNHIIMCIRVWLIVLNWSQQIVSHCGNEKTNGDRLTLTLKGNKGGNKVKMKQMNLKYNEENHSEIETLIWRLFLDLNVHCCFCRRVTCIAFVSLISQRVH